ncbi:hypothetical protein BY458DRAFT_504546 [Sporodiniella umbellata]|nr:hypothetical protein BY458DRAFT_504546 [Sporodiniella umbellata]
MKFFTIQFALAALAVSSLSAATIQARDEPAADQNPTQQNSTLSLYPNSTDIGAFNGTWYLTGLTSSVWKLFEAAQKMNVSAECTQVSFNASSNAALDLISSAFLNQTTTGRGVNGTSAGVFLLQAPSAKINVSAHDLAWTAYMSQVFVNEGQWQNLTTGNAGNSTQSYAIPNSGPIQSEVFTRLIDSNAEVGKNDSKSFDTVFIWGNNAKMIKDTTASSASGSPSSTSSAATPSSSTSSEDGKYAVIFSKNPSVSEETFNKTLALLPPGVNNTTLLLLKDSCTH